MPIKLGDALLYLGAEKSGLKRDLADTERETRSWIGGLGGMLKNALSFAVGGAILSGVKSLAGGVIDLGKNMLLTAGRAEEMMLVAEAVGRTMGLSGERIDAQVQAVKDLGITTTVAAQAVAQFARYQLDLSKSTELARVAQNAAVVAGEDSSATLDGLIYGITTLNTRVLRTRGILVDSAAAFDKYGASIGKAGSELTLAEQQAAFLNAVIEAGVPLQGLYEAAMTTFSKQLRSVPRNLAELGEAFGQHFTRPAGQAVQAFRSFLSSLAKAGSEGGALYPILQKLGAGLSVLMDGLSGVAQKATEAGVSFMSNLGGRLMQAAESALRWGVNISTQLADGLIQGAVQAITAAMNFIGNLLSSWLSPGSPPRVAPQLVQWGAAAMAEFLHGMTQGDFSILQSVQGPLRQALDLLAGMGQIGEQQAQELFVGLSQDLIAALSAFEQTGEMDAAVLARIRAEAGEYGEEIARLIELQLELGQATAEVEEAEEALATAREAQDEARDALDELGARYEWLKSIGAPTEQLEALEGQVEAAQEAYDAASEQAEAAEENLETAQEQEDALGEQVSLQEQVLQQLLQMGQAQADLAEGLEGAIGGGGGAGAKKLKEELGGIGDGIAEDISAALAAPLAPPEGILSSFDEIKEGIRGKLSDIFAPIRLKWENEWSLYFEGLRLKWDWLKGIAEEAWKKIQDAAQPLIDKIKEILPDDFLTKMGEFGGIALVVAAALGILVGAVTIIGAVLSALMSPVVLIIAGIAALYAAWETNLFGIRDALQQVWSVIQTLWGDFKQGLEDVKVAVGLAGDMIRITWDKIKTWTTEKWGEVITFFEELPAKALAWGIGIVTSLWDGLKEIWENVKEWFGGLGTTIGELISGIPGDLLQAGKDIVNGLWNGLKEVWESVKRWWDENVGGLIDKAKDLLGISSPSRVFMEIGAAAAEGLAIGVKSVPVPLPAIGQAGGVVDQRSYTSKTVFNVPTGRAWTREDLAEMRRQDEARERAWRR